MPEPQIPRRVNTTALFVTGTLCVLLGLFMLSQRFGFAELFLDAHFQFGTPITNADALKAQFVSLGSAILILKGIVIVVTGFVFLSRNNANLSSAVRTAPSTQR